MLQFTSYDYGEEWLNYMEDSKIYENVVLTEDLSQNFNEGDSLSFDFKKVNKLEGNVCDIGGLPPTKIKIFNITSKN